MKITANPQIVRFIVLAYVFTWLAWLPGILSSAGLIPAIPWLPFFALGICGPLGAAMGCLYQEGGWPAVKNWLRKGFTHRVPWQWWLYILFIPFIVPALALLIHRWLGGAVVAPVVLQQPWLVFPIILLMVTIGDGKRNMAGVVICYPVLMPAGSPGRLIS